MARQLDQILAELDAGYNPQKQAIQQRIDALPAQADAEIEGLKGQQTQAFDDILAGARNRGLGFSGIPVGEQAKYTSTQFLPAVARVRQSQNEARGSLYDALNNVALDQRKTAMGVYQSELDRDEQARQFNTQQRASAASNNALASIFGGNPQPQQLAAPQVAPQQQRDYNFVKNLINDVNGGNGDTTAMIIRQARAGDARSKEIMRAFYQLQGKDIPANFRSFL